jgi:hypothetical protein
VSPTSIKILEIPDLSAGQLPDWIPRGSPMAKVYFRHEEMDLDLPDGLSDVRKALYSAADEFGMKRSLPGTDVRFRSADIFVYERLLMVDKLDGPPSCMVWAEQKENSLRHQQFRGKRVLDVVYEMATEEGHEYMGSLMRGNTQVVYAEVLKSGEHLSRTLAEFAPCLPRDSDRVELCPQEGYWSVGAELAHSWLYQLNSRIVDRRVWITRNGRYWTDGVILAGDNFRIAGSIPTGIPSVPDIRTDFAPQRFDGKA